MDDREKRILNDLENRRLKVACFICNDRDGELTAITYDREGLVSNISNPVKKILIQEQLKGRMVKGIMQIG